MLHRSYLRIKSLALLFKFGDSISKIHVFHAYFVVICWLSGMGVNLALQLFVLMLIVPLLFKRFSNQLLLGFVSLVYVLEAT